MCKLIDWFFHENTGLSKSEKKELSKILLFEIISTQDELNTLANCRNKAYNEFTTISDDDKLPKNLYMPHQSYSAIGSNMRFLDARCMIKLSTYWEKIDDIKEQYKKLGIIHDSDPNCLNKIEMRSSMKATKALNGILDFLIYVENVHDDGEKIITCLKKNRKIIIPCAGCPHSAASQ